jgi:hypothetical protein
MFPLRRSPTDCVNFSRQQLQGHGKLPLVLHGGPPKVGNTDEGTTSKLWRKLVPGASSGPSAAAFAKLFGQREPKPSEGTLEVTPDICYSKDPPNSKAASRLPLKSPPAEYFAGWKP